MAAENELDLQGLLLGTEADDVVVALYRDGATAHSFDDVVDATGSPPAQTHRRVRLGAEPVTAGTYRVLLRVGGQQARRARGGVPVTTAATVTFSPALMPDDELAHHWLRQATVRLRREVLWMWHQRGQAPGAAAVASPPCRIRPAGRPGSLHGAELRFFERDATARYLTTQITAPEPDAPRGAPRGSFSWVDRELRLEPPERFLLSLAILTGFDSAAGSVVATCLNDNAATQPTLAWHSGYGTSPSRS